MAVRTDQVQLDISFITDESKAFAKTLLDTKKLTNEIEASRKAVAGYNKELEKTTNTEEERKKILEKIAVEEKKIHTNLTAIATESKKVAAIDLSKLTPAQLVERAKQLEQSLRNMSQTSPAFATLSGELAGVRKQLGEIRNVQSGIEARGGKLGALVGLAGGLGLAVGAAELIRYANELRKTGLALESLDKKAATVLGDAEGYVRDFARRSANELGFSQRQFVGLAASIADLLVPMGFTQQVAAEMSSELVRMGGVLSEWSQGKVDAAGATEILQKALLGERDALNTLGIDIKQSTIDAELKRRGMADLTGESLRQAEALITLEQVMKQSGAANEAWEKNSNSATRQQARLNAQLQELKDALATGVLPLFAALVDIALPVAKGFATIAEWVTKAADKVGGFGNIIANFIPGLQLLRVATGQTPQQKAVEQQGETDGKKDADSYYENYIKSLENQLNRLSKTGTRKAKKTPEPDKTSKPKPSTVVDFADLSPEEQMLEMSRQTGEKRITEAEQQEARLLGVARNANEQRLEEFSDAAQQQYQLEETRAERSRQLDEETTRRELENAEKRKAAQRASVEASITTLSNALSITADFLEADENTRKKHAGKIKALRKGEVVLAGIAEVQKIWAGAAQYGVLAPIIGGVMTAVAALRTGLALKKIDKQQFAAGGFTGQGYGRPDRTGYRPAGVVHEGEWVGPKWMVEGNAPLFAALEQRRRLGYASGGFVTANTTPSSTVQQPGALGGGNFEADLMLRVVTRFEAAVTAMPRRVQASVNYFDIEEKSTQIGTIRSEAGI